MNTTKKVCNKNGLKNNKLIIKDTHIGSCLYKNLYGKAT